MLKKKIKILTAMLAIVLIIAAVTSTNAKYTGNKTINVDMDIESYYSSMVHTYLRDELKSTALYDGLTEVHRVYDSDSKTYKYVWPTTYEYTVKSTDGKKSAVLEFPCRILRETNNVEVSKAKSGGNILKITTIRSTTKDYTDKCYDPYIVLDFITDFRKVVDNEGNMLYPNGIPGACESNNDIAQSSVSNGIDTSIFRYALIPYYCPDWDGTFPSESATADPKNVEAYSVADFNHLRIYTSTTENSSTLATNGGSSPVFGTNRYFILPKSIQNDNKGKWICEIVDLAAANKNGLAKGDNGNPNWDGYIYQLRIDIGQIGGYEAWQDQHDCPVGKSVYIGEILFFSSYYGACRAAINQSYGIYKNAGETYDSGVIQETFDPSVSCTFSDPITVTDGLSNIQLEEIKAKKAELDAAAIP